MPFLTVNGRPAERGRLTLPRRGIWQAEIVMQGRAFDFDQVSIALGGVISFRGTVREGGSGGNTRDTTPILVQGGAGGLGKQAQAQHYRNVAMRIPLERALSDVGETLSPASTESFLVEEMSHWVTMVEPAQRVVENLVRAVNATWRVLGDGRVWVGEETWPEVPKVGYSVVGEWPTSRQVRLVLDSPLLLPGCTFEKRKIAQVQHNVTPESITTDVWFEQ